MTLIRQDYIFYDWGIVILILRIKTIQFKERSLEILIARCLDRAPSKTDLFWTGKTHFHQLPSTGKYFAFRLLREAAASTTLVYVVYQRIFKILASRARLVDSTSLSSHSLRQGGCTSLHFCGAEIEELKFRGDWWSGIVYDYNKTSLSTRIDSGMSTTVKLSLGHPGASFRGVTPTAPLSHTSPEEQDKLYESNPPPGSFHCYYIALFMSEILEYKETEIFVS